MDSRLWQSFGHLMFVFLVIFSHVTLVMTLNLSHNVYHKSVYSTGFWLHPAVYSAKSDKILFYFCLPLFFCQLQSLSHIDMHARTHTKTLFGLLLLGYSCFIFWRQPVSEGKNCRFPTNRFWPLTTLKCSVVAWPFRQWQPHVQPS